MITEEQYDILAQKAHFLGGFSAVLLSVVWFHSPWIGLLLLLIYAAKKEFWYDYKYETPEIRGSSMNDFMWYITGALVGFLVYSL